MGKNDATVAEIIERFQGQEFAAQYLGFFECFNKGLFFEAHEVLEELWLPLRKQPNGLFYKGLIQLAGAFVHLQKERLRPAASLFELARTNLERYSPIHDRLDVLNILEMIRIWRSELDESGVNPLHTKSRPEITLICP
jgi:predicted metal-dependent hydrolase